LERLEDWTINPWRKYSLDLIVLLLGFSIGTSIGVINGVLALMDPIGAMLTVFFIEIMVRARRNLPNTKIGKLSLRIIDFARFGILYGLISEGFKLL
tara:strand:+ start:216 stop:506 length:291 start_codon:yes stop_codon:yes gene_type:complete